MKMRNHPNDNICHRAVSRRATPRLRGWMAANPTVVGHDGIMRTIELLEEYGAVELYVGELGEADDGAPKLLSLIASLPRTDNKIAKLGAKIKDIEQGFGVDEPGSGIGFHYALVSLAP